MNLSLTFVTPDATERPIEELVLAAVRGGATIVQLRDKSRSDAEMIRTARSLKQMLARFGVPLVINDRVAVALASDADGVHIGQTDGPPADVRGAIGPRRTLGLSIETMDQLGAVPHGIVDYIGVGPLRATATKPDHGAPLGLEGLAAIVRAAPLPCVAIGGLSLADVVHVKRCGAAGIAVVSAISAAPDPEAAARALADAWRQA